MDMVMVVWMIIVNDIRIGIIRIRGLVVEVSRIVIVVVIMHVIMIGCMVVIVIIRLGSRRFWVRLQPTGRWCGILHIGIIFVIVVGT